jgi:SAM-dependent MidA family methyltransferase
LAIFIAETAVWFVHDLRQAIHKSLRERNAEYQEKQRQVLERARTIQQLKEEEETRSNRNIRLERASTEFFDAVDE